jgi:hypothetical protein
MHQYVKSHSRILAVGRKGGDLQSHSVRDFCLHSRRSSTTLLDSVVADDAQKQKALSQLRRIIEEKTRVSYLGELYGQDDISEMLKRLERFRTWARGILNR